MALFRPTYTDKKTGERMPAFIVLSLLLVAACDSPRSAIETGRVSRVDFGQDWPLSVESGVLACDADAVTFKANGTVYAVNGTAMTRRLGRPIDEIWASPDPMWVTDPATKKRVNLAPPKKNIGALIEAGRKLCSER